MKKTEERIPWSKVLRTNTRALRLLYKRHPQMVLSRLINVVWTALTPYVGIFLSALIIDELAGNRNIEHLQALILITLVSAAAIALVSALLNKWMETQNAGMWLKVEHVLSEKMFDMDLQVLITRIQRNFCLPYAKI